MHGWNGSDLENVQDFKYFGAWIAGIVARFHSQKAWNLACNILYLNMSSFEYKKTVHLD